MIGTEYIHHLAGRELHDRDGNKIGTVGQIWDDGAGRPGWASVRTGLFGMNESLVPLNDADLRDDRVVVPYDKAKVKDAPNVDASEDEPLSPDEVDRLYQHYGLHPDDGSQVGDTGYAENTGYAANTGTSGVAEGDRDRGAAGDGMTRSEERLNVDKQRDQVGRARLRKYVVTERQQVDVPVEREEARIEREPITDANRDAAYSGPDIAESEHEVTLHAERPVVETETVPVERVRLGKETVREQQAVGGEVRKERVEADLPGEDGRRTLH